MAGTAAALTAIGMVARDLEAASASEVRTLPRRNRAADATAAPRKGALAAVTLVARTLPSHKPAAPRRGALAAVTLAARTLPSPKRAAPRKDASPDVTL